MNWYLKVLKQYISIGSRQTLSNKRKTLKLKIAELSDIDKTLKLYYKY